MPVADLQDCGSIPAKGIKPMFLCCLVVVETLRYPSIETYVLSKLFIFGVNYMWK
jgi:hypothetical protein